MIVSVGAGGVNSYTRGWLQYMARWSGMEREDVELVSMCDPDDFYLLLRPRRARFRILGGAEAFYEKLYKPFCDAVVVGEGFQFFRDYKESGSFDFIGDAPYIYTGSEGKVVASSRVDWDLAPPIKVGKRKVMVLGSRGCKNKCRFCFTSWTTRHRIRKKMPRLPRGVVTNIISNDNAGSEGLSAAVKSMTIRSYLGMTRDEAAKTRVYRFGVEGLTEETRKYLGKPIRDEELRMAVRIAGKLNHEIVFFVIAGIDPQESFISFLENIGHDHSLRPKIILKGTYFNPCRHTPLESYDIRDLHQWDKKWIYGKLKSFSPRYKLNLRSDMGYHLWRAMFHRTRGKRETEFLWSLRRKCRDDLLAAVDGNGLAHLYDTPVDSCVEFDWR